MPARTKAHTKRTPQDAPLHQRTAYESWGSQLQPIYTHGTAQVALCGTLILPCADGARILRRHGDAQRVESWTLQGEDAAAAVSVNADGSLCAVAGRSGFVDIVGLGEGGQTQLRRRFRPFERTLPALAVFDASGGLLALGSRDGHIRVYDAETADCTHVFRAPGASLSALAFNPIPERLQLVAGAEDGTLLSFNLATRARKAEHAARHHVNAVSAIAFVDGGDALVSASMDKTLCLAQALDLKLKRLVSADQPLAGLCAPPAARHKRVVAVAEGGLVSMWDMDAGKLVEGFSLQLPVTKSEDDEDEADDIVVIYAGMCEENEDGSYNVLAALSDKTVLVARISPDAPPKLVDLLCGNLEEVYGVLPLRTGDDDGSMEFALATNSPCVWVMRPPGSVEHVESWRCTAGLQGHTGVVLSIDSLESGKVGSHMSTFVASASRDTTSRVWRRCGPHGRWTCIAVARGHTEAAGGVALSRNSGKGLFFLVTAAADRTLKLWSLDKALEKAPAASSAAGFHLSDDCATELRTKWTVLAHDKDINAVAVAPDALTIATGSQDKTLKLWDAAKGKLRAVCRGHRRGLWDVSFSEVDKVVATSSGDGTVRIWNVQTGACLRSLEGHLAGVLKTVFLTKGTQIASSGADGLIKIWQARTGECCTTVDAHEDRVWALASVDDGNKLVSGSGDGILAMWEDRTLQKADEAAAERERLALAAQDVTNDVNARRWAKAARGALKLGMPRKLKAVIEQLVASADDADVELTAMVRGLGVEKDEDGDEEEKGNKVVTQLLVYCRDWNATGGPKSAALAARTLQAVFRVWTPVELTAMMTADRRALVEAIVAHSARHYERVDALGTKVCFMEHVLESMKALPDMAFVKNERVKRKKISAATGGAKRQKKGHDAGTEY